MTPEASRRHYLDAMGVTAWACRFVLPGALPTEACEWEAPEKTEPRQALHALLDQPVAPKSAPAARETTTRPADAAPAQSARALLGDSAPAERQAPAPASAPEAPTAPAPRAEPVAFTLTCTCVAGRWLSVHPGEPSAVERRLLANMLRAAGVLAGAPLDFTTFHWPPMADAFTPEDPLGEAREGIAAFIKGAARRQGWQLEGLLYWADAPKESADDTLARVLEIESGQSRTLDLLLWRAPALGSLTDAPAKRALWPALMRLAHDATPS